jgi:small-conductance mechanosensitive channel
VFGKDVHGNAIVHQLLAYTNDPEQMKQVKSALLYTIQDLFHERKLNVLSSTAEG